MFLTPYSRRSLNNYDPFKAMEDMERRFFGDGQTGAISTDIHDDGKAYILEADLPGFKKEDISVDVTDGCLTISAERHSGFEEKDKKGSYVRCERSYGRFSRSFDTTGIDVGAIKASFENGVLKLTLPKLTEAKPESRRLEIQ